MAVRADGSVCCCTEALFHSTASSLSLFASCLISAIVKKMFRDSCAQIVSHIIQRLTLLRICLSAARISYSAPENVDMARAESTFVAKLRVNGKSFQSRRFHVDFGTCAGSEASASRRNDVISHTIGVFDFGTASILPNYCQ
eukprot:478344-Pleurochrysis_carterae.AAC.2